MADDPAAKPRSPRVGDLVMIYSPDSETGGMMECPAIVTEVDTPGSPASEIRATIFLPYNAPQPIFATPHTGGPPLQHQWFWRPD
jgi:hypothetical protein